jgi:acyl-CoA thioester hydrolase
MNEYRLELEVRDYECDIQGIVNNGVYLHYLEHARHKHLMWVGGDFAELAQSGLNLVVTRAEVDYKRSLRSGDVFSVSSVLERKGRLRFCFRQKIECDGNLIIDAIITGTALNAAGRPSLEGLNRIFELFNSSSDS